MTETQTTSLIEDAQRLRELSEAEDEAKAVYDEAKSLRERAESDLIERMQAERCDSVKTGGINFVPAQTVYGSVQDRAEFIEWAEENDPSLIESKERKKLVNALVRECLDNGEPLPPGLGHYVKEYISQRAR